MEVKISKLEKGGIVKFPQSEKIELELIELIVSVNENYTLLNTLSKDGNDISQTSYIYKPKEDSGDKKYLQIIGRERVNLSFEINKEKYPLFKKQLQEANLW